MDLITVGLKLVGVGLGFYMPCYEALVVSKEMRIP